MKHIFYGICGIFALGKVILSFVNPEKETTIFTLSINIWVYRLVWILVVIGMVHYFYSEIKKK